MTATQPLGYLTTWPGQTADEWSYCREGAIGAAQQLARSGVPLVQVWEVVQVAAGVLVHDEVATYRSEAKRVAASLPPRRRAGHVWLAAS